MGFSGNADARTRGHIYLIDLQCRILGTYGRSFLTPILETYMHRALQPLLFLIHRERLFRDRKGYARKQARRYLIDVVMQLLVQL